MSNTRVQKFISLFIMQLALISCCTAQDNHNIMVSDTSLHYIIRESKKSVMKSPLLILLHGHGSNENDLFSFSSQIPDNWIVVSVRGPYQLAENSYRWYDVKMANGKIVINIDEEERSRKKLMQLIAEITQKYNVDSQKITVAGFSQGANMSSAISLTMPEKIAGFAVFSGRFIEEIIPLISTPASLKSVKCFLAHGSKDYMLPIAYAREIQQMLQSLGIPVTFSEDAVAHSISPKQLEDFTFWLKQF